MTEIAEGSEFIARRMDIADIQTKVKVIEKGERLGQGKEGKINRLIVAPVSATERRLPLAYKELTEYGQKMSKKVFENYADAKVAGLPVPRTLRITDDEKGILMTDLTEGGKNIVLSQNNVTLHDVMDLYEKKPEIMEKFTHGQHILSDEVKKQTDAFVDKANNAQMKFHIDSWFIIIKPDGSYDFILGDLSDISKEEGRDEQVKDANDYNFDEFKKLISMVQRYGTDKEAAKKDLIYMDLLRTLI